MKEFKINNIKFLKRKFKIMSIFLGLNIIITAFIYAYKLLNTETTFLVFILPLLIFFYIFHSIYMLKCTEIENSGYVLTIKQYHPLQNNKIKPILELPVECISDAEVIQNKWSIILIIAVDNVNNQKKYFKIPLPDMKENMIKHIKAKLSMAS